VLQLYVYYNYETGTVTTLQHGYRKWLDQPSFMLIHAATMVTAGLYDYENEFLI
jgi:hypothetical protein